MGRQAISNMSTSRKPPPRSIQSAAITLRQFADSLVGLTVAEAKSTFSRAKRRMTKWEQGKQLVVTFPKYEVRLLFFGDTVLTASIQILSK